VLLRNTKSQIASQTATQSTYITMPATAAHYTIVQLTAVLLTIIMTMSRPHGGAATAVLGCTIESVNVNFVSGPSSSVPLAGYIYNASDVIEHFRAETVIMKNTLMTTLSCVDSRNEGKYYGNLYQINCI